MPTTPATMRAAVLHRLGEPIALETVPTPTPGAGQILVKVHACGVCHTDLHACLGDWRAKPVLPIIPGHEITGEIVALGPNVTSRQLGQRVGVFWLNHTCGRCEFCGDGWESLCPSQVNTGFAVPGGFAEYTCVAADFAVPLPASLDFVDAAPLMCAGVSAYKAIRETELQPGQRLAIVGCGGVGHLAIQYAKAAGLVVVALDVHDAALALAHDLGADLVLDARDPDIARRIKKHDGGVHGVLAAASSAAAIRLAVDLLRRRGIVVMVGLPPGEASFPVFDVVVKRFTLRGSIGGTRTDVTAALETAATNGIQAQIETRRLEEINDVFANMKNGTLTGRCVLRLS